MKPGMEMDGARDGTGTRMELGKDGVRNWGLGMDGARNWGRSQELGMEPGIDAAVMGTSPRGETPWEVLWGWKSEASGEI